MLVQSLNNEARALSIYVTKYSPTTALTLSLRTNNAVMHRSISKKNLSCTSTLQFGVKIWTHSQCQEYLKMFHKLVSLHAKKLMVNDWTTNQWPTQQLVYTTPSIFHLHGYMTVMHAAARRTYQSCLKNLWWQDQNCCQTRWPLFTVRPRAVSKALRNSILHKQVSGNSVKFQVLWNNFILMTMDMIVDIWIHWFETIFNIIKGNKYFIGILNSWIALPAKDMKLNVQRIKLFHCSKTSPKIHTFI